eukprot:9483820-Pyramimonas_sp.AAC.1
MPLLVGFSLPPPRVRKGPANACGSTSGPYMCDPACSRARSVRHRAMLALLPAQVGQDLRRAVAA